MIKNRRIIAVILTAPWILLCSTLVLADEGDRRYIVGVKIRAGGRYDDVRRCVASSKGTPGGPAMDISAFAEFPVGNDRSLQVDLPIMRPILFAVAFNMLQFEPSATLKFRESHGGSTDWVLGPTLGVSLHYGPDYHSDLNDRHFFAAGPIIGGYFGLDFPRPGKFFNFELGITPYLIPLFGIHDSANHKGIVIGGLLDASFRLAPSNG